MFVDPGVAVDIRNCIDAIALVGDDTTAEPSYTLSEQRIELLKGGLR